MSLHKNLIDSDIHALAAATYVDAAARDADTDFQVTTNIDKLVRVDSPASYFILISVGPTVWTETGSEGLNEFTELLDTPSSYSGQAGLVLQVNQGETTLEFGQALRTIDSPTFLDLILTGDLTVQGTTTTLNTQNLLVEDINIEIGKVATPTDVTADGGGITLKGATDKTILWNNSTDSWNFNQTIIAEGQLVVGGITAPVADASVDFQATDKAVLYNRLTTTQRDALTAVKGMVIYNITLDDVEFFNGVFWGSMSGGDVVGPASSVVGSIPTYSTTGGKNIQDQNSVFISSGDLGIGISNPNDRLHVLSSGTSGYTHTDRGILITDSIGPRLTFEDAGETVNDRIMCLEYADQKLTFVSLSDDGLTDDVSDILVINRDGKVGIGTSSPNQKLHVNRSGTSGFTAGLEVGILITDAIAPGIVFEDTGETVDDRVMRLVYTDQQLKVASLNDLGSVAFQDNILVIDRDGRVGIGTDIMGSKLTVKSSSSSSIFEMESDTNTAVCALRSTSVGGDTWFFVATGDGNPIGGGHFRIRNNDASAELTILGNGNVGIGNTAPTELLDVDGNINTSGNLTVTGNVPARGLDRQFQLNDNGVLAGTSALVFTSGGTLIIAPNSTAITGADNANKFFIRDGANEDLFFVNTITNRVGIGDFLGAGNIPTQLALTRGLSVGHGVWNTSTDTTTLTERYIYACGNTTVDRTITIKSADITEGRIFVIKDQTGDLSANGTKIIIATEGAQLIDGQATLEIIEDFGSVELYAADGDLWTSSSTPITKQNAVLQAFSVAATQGPSATDTDYQIEFGAAQGSASTPVQLSVAGALTINESGLYTVRFFGPISRSGIGGTAIIGFRPLLDTGSGPVQFSNTIPISLANSETLITLNPGFPFNFNAGDIMTFEIIRDSAGVNEGDLTAVNFTPAGWNDSPSAGLIVLQHKKSY